MILVLDASAAAEIVMRRTRSAKFTSLTAEAARVIVPELYFFELTNLFWKYHHLARIDKDQCVRALTLAGSLPDESVPAAELVNECFDMACLTGHSAYDLFYLVLARRRGAVLATLDKKLVRLCRKHGVRLPD